MPTTTAKEMLASGEWAKTGRKAYRHANGTEIVHDGNCWVVNGKRYAALWTARMVAEGKL
jgi:N-acetylneuraminic acid mutarotase